MGKRYVGLGKETVAYGTPAVATRYLEAIASIKPDHNWVIPPPIASRAFRKCNLGPYRARGNIGEFPVEPENIGELLLGVFGSVSTANPVPGVYVHTFNPADTLPSYTVRLGVEQTERVLPGGLVESLTVKFAHDKDLMATAEILSGFPETKATIGTPTISPLQALNMRGPDVATWLTLDLEGGSGPARNIVYDLEITIKNNIPFERGALDGRTFATKRVGHREVTGKLSAYFDNITQYDNFIAGTKFVLQIEAGGPLITAGHYYYLEMTMYDCIYLKDLVPDVKPQNEPLVVEAPFKAFYEPTTYLKEAWAELKNAITTY